MKERKQPRIRDAFRNGWTVYRTHWGEAMRLMLYEGVLRLAVPVPLLFLLSPSLRWLALLSVPLFCLAVLPARQSAADAIQQSLDGGPLFNERLYRGRVPYGKRVLHGLKHALWMLLWVLPWLLCACGVGVWLYRLFKPAEIAVGTNDVITILNTFMETIKDKHFVSLGEFFGTVGAMLGGTADNGSVMRILIPLLVVPVAGFVLSALVGFAFHSPSRHLYPYRAEGKHIRVERIRSMLVWLLASLPIIAALAVEMLVLYLYVRGIFAQLKQLQLSLPPLSLPLALLGVACLAAAVILKPLQALIVGAWVHLHKDAQSGADGAEE
ncbi:MAG: hypothetical protein IKS31_07755 [Clostridia bacterium]|nr:hypothetical protein [Clostridia bacterium]